MLLYKIALCGQRQAGCMVKFKVNYSYLSRWPAFSSIPLAAVATRGLPSIVNCSVQYILVTARHKAELTENSQRKAVAFQKSRYFSFRSNVLDSRSLRPLHCLINVSMRRGYYAILDSGRLPPMGMIGLSFRQSCMQIPASRQISSPDKVNKYLGADLEAVVCEEYSVGAILDA